MAEKDEARIFTIPNLLSFLRICMIPLIVWLYMAKESFWAAGWLLVLSGITDLVDGYIARRFHMVSSLGKALDPIADKLTQAAVLVCLLFRFPLMLLPFILMAAKEIFTGITNLLIIRKTGQVQGAKWHGKAATAILYGMMIVHVFWRDIPAAVSCIFTAACLIMIAVSFFLYAVGNIRLLRHGQELN